MTKDTTPEMESPNSDQAMNMLDLLHSINPHQREQFEAVFTELLRHTIGAVPKPNLFESDKHGQYEDTMVSMAFQLWLNAKLNHMNDMERRAEQIREAMRDGLFKRPEPNEKPH